MVEGISCTLKAAIRDHSLSGLNPHDISPPISHNQFVDDILLMGLSTAKEARCFRSIIDLFCEASGMEVNLTKSQVFFFNTPLVIQNHLTLLLAFTHSALLSVYKLVVRDRGRNVVGVEARERVVSDGCF